MKTAIALLSILALFLPAQTTDAKEKGAKKPKQEAAKHGKKKDANGDGDITEAEFIAAAKNADKAKKKFAKLDTNDDGVLNKKDHSGKKGGKKKGDKKHKNGKSKKNKN
jgi:Ca2+-binding EF-hand superfamily protein